MKCSKLGTYFEKIENTTSRLEITYILADLFKELTVSEIEHVSYLLQGRIVPLFVKADFGMAEKMIVKAAVSALQLDQSDFTKKLKTIGDIGKTVEFYKKEYSSFEEKDLTVDELYESLKKITEANGPGSQEMKIQLLSLIIRQIDPLAARYIARMPAGAMRLGFSDMTMLDGLSWMVKGDKSLRPVIEQAYHVRPDLGFIASELKKHGEKGVSNIKPEVFTPIIMMRAERLSSGQEIVDKIGKSIIESKYDGFRLQIHAHKKGHKHEVKLYSRGLEDVSYMYPDLIEGVIKEVRAESVIMEGEALGFDPQTVSFLPFQETVQRKRKHGIEEMAKEIPLKLFAFELLYLDGKSYIKEPFSERRKALEKAVKLSGNVADDTIILSPEVTTDDPKKIELLFDDAITRGLEGIVAKKMDGVYQPGARGWNWIKVKRSYSSKIEDTIDCVVMGYDAGKGKRTAFGIGAFLVGVYDEKEDKYLTVAKIGTGLSDDEWRELKIKGDKFKSDKQPALYVVDKMMNVDVWVKPTIVVEIKADELTRSTVHTAGRVMKESKSGTLSDVEVPGYALRFPRLVQFRKDKRPEDSTSLKEIEEMFKDQKTAKG